MERSGDAYRTPSHGSEAALHHEIILGNWEILHIFVGYCKLLELVGTTAEAVVDE